MAHDIPESLNTHHCASELSEFDERVAKNRRQSLWVLIITSIAMVAEIYYGYVTNSMALLADGWHMATHAGALGIAYVSYILATSKAARENLNFGGGKIIFLGGFTSSILLLLAAFGVALEAIQRVIKPEPIQFNEALFVAVIGLLVNLVCAWILRDHHSHGHSHDHGHHHGHGHSHDHDHNIRGAYLHVIADALTSVAAIAALALGKIWGLTILDPIIAIVASLVIVKWAINLIRDSGWELLDGHAREVDYPRLRARIESTGARIIDLHVWRVAPQTLNCELVVHSPEKRGTELYRTIVESEFGVNHSVIEER